MMLPRLRRFRFLSLCCASALGWVTAGTLDMLGVVDIGDDMVVIAGAGLITVVLLGHVGVQMNAHQFRHRRLDKQGATVAKMMRDGCHAENWPVPPGLEDERTAATANVRELRPREPRARHARARQMRP